MCGFAFTFHTKDRDKHRAYSWVNVADGVCACLTIQKIYMSMNGSTHAKETTVVETLVE